MTDLMIAGLMLLCFASGLAVGAVGVFLWVMKSPVGPRF